VREPFNASAYLKENPSLKPRRAEIFADVYVQACRLASAETGLPMKRFPTEPPFTWEQASADDYQPWTAIDPSTADT
jgi:hypothetical protein